MSLEVTLSTKLQTRALADKLLASLAAPTANLGAVTVPASTEQLAAVTSGAARIDLSSLGGALARLKERADPLLHSLPVATDVVAPLTTTLDLIEKTLSDPQAGDLAARLRDLVTRLGQELEAPHQGGLLAVLHRVAQGLSEAPEGKLLLQLLTSLTRGAGFDLPTKLPLSDALQALDGAVRALGGLMSLESVLSEAERLTSAMAAQLDVDAMRHGIAALQACLDGDTVTLPAFVAGVRADDPAAVAAAAAAVVTCAARLDPLKQSLSAAMGLGEATLVYLDIDKVLLEIEAAAALVRTADLEALGRLVHSLAASLEPLLAFDLSTAPTQSLDALLSSVEAEVTTFAATLSELDVAAFIKPLPEGIETVTGLFDRIADLITRITLAFQTAMNQVRDAVAALPLGFIADALRGLLEPITQLISAIQHLVDDIEHALDTAVTATKAALGQIEGGADTFKGEVDKLFAEAKVFVEQLRIDQVLGAIADNVSKFADVLAKAQMKPYFDTAADAIGMTGDVIGAIPFGLLPDSMKSQVDEAVRPIKETDAQAVEAQIEGLLQISAEGKFELRGQLEQAIAGIQKEYDALIAAIKEADPRRSLAQVDAKLQEVAAKIHEISPALTLQPVQDAIDKVKAAITSVDLDRQLQPVRDVFTDILKAIDQYEPGKLVGDVEKRIRAAREKLLAEIHLAQWGPTLDDLLARGNALLDQFDPTRLGKQLEAALGEALTLVDRFPRIRAAGGLGGILASLVNGLGLRVLSTSFEAVLDWLGGASGTAALNARATRISDTVARTRDAVAALDVAALSAGIVQRVSDLRPVVAALVAALPPDASERARLAAAMDRLDAQATFADLGGNRARYLAMLTRSATLAETLRRTGFSEVDVTVTNLRTAMAPLRPSIDFVRQLLQRLGITGLDGGIAGMLRSVLTVAPPQRVTGLVLPIFVALRDRINALLSAIVTPLKDGITKVKQLVDAIDLQPLIAALDGVFNEVKNQIKTLHPDELLKEPLAAFKKLQDDVKNQNPLAKVITIVTDLRDASERILVKLKLETILGSPLAIYDHILAELGRLDVRGLVDPVLVELDNIAHQVDDGLDRTVAAFEKLQAALPGDEGGTISAATGVSVAVG